MGVAFGAKGSPRWQRGDVPCSVVLAVMNEVNVTSSVVMNRRVTASFSVRFGGESQRVSGVSVNGLSSRRSSPVRAESRCGNPGHCSGHVTGVLASPETS